MNSKLIITAVVALVLGIGGGYLLVANSRPDTDEHMMSNGAFMHNGSMRMGGAMGDMRMQPLQTTTKISKT